MTSTIREKMKPLPNNKWNSRKLWAMIAFGGATFVLQWFGKVDTGTWQYLAGPMMAYLAGQAWEDKTNAQNGKG